MNKRTAIIGASDNPNRYAFLAANRLKSYAHPIIPLGIKKGTVADEAIVDIKERPSFEDIHTITMYVGPHHQDDLEDYILSLKPKRIIFNPGAENESLARKAENQGIETMNACTLVMLSANQY